MERLPASSGRNGRLKVLAFALCILSFFTLIILTQMVAKGESSPGYILLAGILPHFPRKKAEGSRGAEGEKRDDHYRRLIDSTGDGYFEIDTSNGEAKFNDNCYTMLGYSRGDFPAGFTNWGSLVCPEDRPRLEDAVRSLAEGRSRTLCLELRVADNGGKYRWVLGKGQFFRSPAGGMLYGLMIDITALKTSEEKLAHLAYHEPLTELPNRKAFFERSDDILAQAARARDESFLAWLYADLDQFNVVNESLGLAAGDELILRAAERIRKSVRASDYLFHFGGDQFMVVATNLHCVTDVVICAEKLFHAFDEPFVLDGRPFFVNISMGLALSPRDGADTRSMLRCAEAALHEAKRERNTYRFFHSELQEEAAGKLQMLAALRQALDRDELVVHFQPIVDGKGRLLSAEALVRWNHPEKGMLLPADFIPLAEESGLIVKLGLAVLEKAAAGLKRLDAAGPGGVRVAVNLSAKQLANRDFVASVVELTERLGVDPGRIRFEITESCIMERLEHTVGLLTELLDRGFTFAIDDFGTGYSSLAYIKTLPVSTLKIDRSFVIGLPDEKHSAAIVSTIIALARGLGMDVIAEGVDCGHQVACLEKLGCERFQGFHFSKPLPIDELATAASDGFRAYAFSVEEGGLAADASPAEAYLGEDAALAAFVGGAEEEEENAAG